MASKTIQKWENSWWSEAIFKIGSAFVIFSLSNLLFVNKPPCIQTGVCKLLFLLENKYDFYKTEILRRKHMLINLYIDNLFFFKSFPNRYLTMFSSSIPLVKFEGEKTVHVPFSGG